MKSAPRFARMIASSLLCLAAFASASFAATKPISNPLGLALDAKGNLYVANSTGNDILVYNPNYVQLTSKTITQNVTNPTAVAFDPQGNLWVATTAPTNGTTYGSVAEYINGKQNTGATITDSIVFPTGLAIDGFGNVWVANNYTNITVYGPAAVYGPPTGLISSFNPPPPVNALSIARGVLAWGNTSGVTLLAAMELLTKGVESGYPWANDTGIALGADANGNTYMTNPDGTVNVATAVDQYFFANVGFPAYGIAIDSVRGRVYLSDYGANKIAVYSTAGALLKTIQ